MPANFCFQTPLDGAVHRLVMVLAHDTLQRMPHHVNHLKPLGQHLNGPPHDSLVVGPLGVVGRGIAEHLPGKCPCIAAGVGLPPRLLQDRVATEKLRFFVLSQKEVGMRR